MLSKVLLSTPEKPAFHWTRYKLICLSDYAGGTETASYSEFLPFIAKACIKLFKHNQDTMHNLQNNTEIEKLQMM